MTLKDMLATYANNLVGSFYVGNELAKLVYSGGVFDVVSLYGEVSFGALSEVDDVRTIHRLGSAIRRHPGRVMRSNFVSAAVMLDAGAGLSLYDWLKRRADSEWIADQGKAQAYKGLLRAIGRQIKAEN